MFGCSTEDPKKEQTLALQDEVIMKEAPPWEVLQDADSILTRQGRRGG